MRTTALLVLCVAVLVLFPAVQAAESPAAASASPPPPPPKTPSAERGKVVFEQTAQPACKTCHGEKGDGSGAPSLHPADFHDLNRFVTKSDADIWNTITNGKPPNMPAIQGLSDQDKWDVIAYIRSTFMYQGGAAPSGPTPAEGVALKAYWLGLIGLGATFVLMAVSFAVIRFTKKR